MCIIKSDNWMDPFENKHYPIKNLALVRLGILTVT